MPEDAIPAIRAATLRPEADRRDLRRDPPRRDRVRAQHGRDGRGRSLHPLRPDLVGRLGHRDLAPDWSRRPTCCSTRRRQRSTGASARSPSSTETPDRPLARHPRRANHVRPQADRLGGDAAARPGAAGGGPPRDRRRADLRRGRHPCQRAGPVEEIVCGRLGLEPSSRPHPDPSARPPRGVRHRALAVVAATLEKLAHRDPRTSSGPRSARRPSRSRRASRAPPRCRTSATRSSRERICGLARMVARQRCRPWRTWRSGTSATSATRRPSGSSSRTPTSRWTTCCRSSRGIMDGLDVFPERMLANLTDDARPDLLGAGAAGAGPGWHGPQRRVPDRAGGGQAGLGR